MLKYARFLICELVSFLYIIKIYKSFIGNVSQKNQKTKTKDFIRLQVCTIRILNIRLRLSDCISTNIKYIRSYYR